eukprot:299447-Chlamydomonas_euryale.AAC.1
MPFRSNAPSPLVYSLTSTHMHASSQSRHLPRLPHKRPKLPVARQQPTPSPLRVSAAASSLPSGCPHQFPPKPFRPSTYLLPLPPPSPRKQQQLRAFARLCGSSPARAIVTKMRDMPSNPPKLELTQPSSAPTDTARATHGMLRAQKTEANGADASSALKRTMPTSAVDMAA